MMSNLHGSRSHGNVMGAFAQNLQKANLCARFQLSAYYAQFRGQLKFNMEPNIDYEGACIGDTDFRLTLNFDSWHMLEVLQ